MAFWGVVVHHDEPYTLKSDNKKLRITHAALADYTGHGWMHVWSKLKCAVGSNPPVYICALSRDSPSCRVNLVFEEAEEVVFSVKGPRAIHLSGYYVPSSPSTKKDNSTRTNDISTECSNEDATVGGKNSEQKKFAAEEHKLQNNNELVDTNLYQDADENTEKEQQENLFAFDNKQGRKIKNDVAKATVEGNTMLEDAMTVNNKSKENTDAIRDANLPSDTLLHRNEGAIAADQVETNSSNKTISKNLHSKFGETKKHALNWLNCEDAYEEGNFDRNLEDVSHLKVEDQRSSSDKFAEELSPTKKQKTDGQEKEEDDNGTRALSNGMIIKDLEKGRPIGNKAAPGRKVKIYFTAWSRDTGKELHTNVNAKKPLKFRLGDKKVLTGLNIGVDGMRIGARRILFIPPTIGSDSFEEKTKAKIPPNSGIIFEVKLVGVSSGGKAKKCG